MLYYKRILIVSLSLIIVIPLSCNNSKKNEDVKFKANKINEHYSINVLMDKDTLDLKQERGVVNFFFQLNDTVRIHKQDKRHIYIGLGLIPHEDNNTSFSPNDKFSAELNLLPINGKDTLEIPFKIVPNFQGKGTIVGFITDIYELSYYKENNKIRVFTYEHDFSKDVYIK